MAAAKWATLVSTLTTASSRARYRSIFKVVQLLTNEPNVGICSQKGLCARNARFMDCDDAEQMQDIGMHGKQP